jgi:hypothetical protein
MLAPPDDRTNEALRRLAPDSDFQEFMAWIVHSLHEIDRVSRSTMDGAVLRQQQGGAQALAEIVERVAGRAKARAIVAAKPHSGMSR